MNPILNTHEHQGVAVLTFTAADLDQIDPAELEAAFARLAEDLAGQKVVLSLEQVRFMLSTHLGLLIDFYRQLRESGGRLVLIDLDHRLRDLFDVTRLNRFFEIHDNLEQAVRSLVGHVVVSAWLLSGALIYIC